MSRLGIGVIGVGTLGRRHAENLRRAIPAAQLVAVADADGARAKQVAAELEVEHHYSNLEDLLSRKDIHAVVVAAPSRFHAPATRAAAAAGKHVFCEKPPALSMEEAESAMSAVSRAGVQFQIGFMRRYDPPYTRARKLIEAGEIGEPILFKALGRDREPPPRSFFQDGINGTLFLDAAIHEFDLARWLMNDEVAEVHAFGSVRACPELAEFGDVDSAVVNLRFGRGGIGNVECLRKSNYGYDIRTEIIGSKGALQIGYLQQTPQLVLTRGFASYDVVDHWLVRFADAYLNELRDFVDTILTGKSVRVTGEEGLHALAVCFAAERSYHESRPVALDAGSKFAARTNRRGISGGAN
ncbi:MAG: Gfo/Idh/MocA family oxidoreductase [Candidatus Acidiferrales bacterium]